MKSDYHNLLYLYPRIPSNREKEQSSDMCCNVDEPREHPKSENQGL